MHIFKNDALASTKRSFSMSQSSFWQNGALASTACTFCMFMTCAFLLAKCHLEPLPSKMCTPLKDFGHFGASWLLVAMRMLRFRIFWSLLGPGMASWGLLATLLGVPGASSCLLEASGALQLEIERPGSNTHTHTHDGNGSECHSLLRGVPRVVSLPMWREGGWECIFHLYCLSPIT